MVLSESADAVASSVTDSPVGVAVKEATATLPGAGLVTVTECVVVQPRPDCPSR